jgi:hemerythrin-like domain-containing protein
MTQPIRLSALVGAPSATFEEPFDMLEACHQRVQRMLTLLAKLRAHVRDHGSDTQAQQAARDVMRYFDMAAPQHHLDEELHVFPPLLAQGDARVVAVVRRLQEDHLRMESRWQDAREVLTLVSEARVQRLGEEDEARLDAFAGLYDEHIRSEEEIAYPAARRVIDAQGRAEMSGEMMRRRGVK